MHVTEIKSEPINREEKFVAKLSERRYLYCIRIIQINRGKEKRKNWAPGGREQTHEQTVHKEETDLLNKHVGNVQPHLWFKHTNKKSSHSWL